MRFTKSISNRWIRIRHSRFGRRIPRAATLLPVGVRGVIDEVRYERRDPSPWSRPTGAARRDRAERRRSAVRRGSRGTPWRASWWVRTGRSRRMRTESDGPGVPGEWPRFAREGVPEPTIAAVEDASPADSGWRSGVSRGSPRRGGRSSVSSDGSASPLVDGTRRPPRAVGLERALDTRLAGGAVDVGTDERWGSSRASALRAADPGERIAGFPRGTADRPRGGVRRRDAATAGARGGWHGSQAPCTGRTGADRVAAEGRGGDATEDPGP